MTIGKGCLWWLLLGACAGAAHPEATAGNERTFAAIASGDPLFGGGAFVEQRLFAAPSFVAIGDPAARAAFMQRVRHEADAQALALAWELVTEEVAAGVRDFVASPPNAVLWAAEALALAAHPWPGDDFAAQTAAVYGDPARVGAAATQLVRDLAAGDDYRSISPPRLAIELGAMRVSPAEAEAIAAFAATPAGVHWIAVRNAALARSQARFVEVLAEARANGFVRDLFDGAAALDVPLPTALGGFADEPRTAPVVTFTVDAEGRVRSDGLELGSVAAEGELRAALRRLRERGVAEGRMSVVQELVDGQPVPCVAEPVGVAAAEGVPWRHIEALLKLFAEPGIAFWQIELDVDPKVVPDSMRGPGGG